MSRVLMVQPLLFFFFFSLLKAFEALQGNRLEIQSNQFDGFLGERLIGRTEDR